ncbi:Rossmann-like and DUF2520 domain-containing protein [Christiangramia sabulilitoris]|uniref:DUF2520 domain-containing protein n=1 Tax=Christiangramia sabulilitoris TaxID=2583991 RepID=A0A550I692_9FLAO|nr:DUF2520 domain-containing protein [Christiangramia sabulilitoris]TRO66328.1 DUF2520 domain-containing protein [Christiangramia sabulilitoris]
MIKVVIIGAGNVASHLYRSFSEAQGLEIIQVFNRNIDHLNFVHDSEICISDPSKLKEAHLYLIAIKDEAITALAQELNIKTGLVTHTSGSVSMDALMKFENYGVFYPIQTFSKNMPVDFSEVPLCLEANTSENLNFLKEVAAKVSNKVFEVNSEQRRALHLSAVFVNNFSNHLFTLAQEYCQQNELPFGILRPLIKETVSKIEILEPYSAQTGPAMRNDQETINAHLAMLDEDKQKIYKILTESIQKLYGKKL